MSMYISENEIAIKKDDFIAAQDIVSGLLRNDYVVMLSREENLIIINYEWAPNANRNGVVFRKRTKFEEEGIEVTSE